MAGIAGVFGASAQEETMKSMLKTLRHRGPDGERLAGNGDFNAGVVSSDLSAERGDGYAAAGDIHVFFDGDVYQETGASSGLSDAEFALDLYQKHGRSFPAHLKGVFSCAVIDGDRIVLARDPVGVRPLYFGFDDKGSLFFASELKGLSGHVDEAIEMLPATTYSNAGGAAAYNPVMPECDVPFSFDEAVARTRELLVDATAKRIRDGAVGVSLMSGGLDSSIIAAIVKELGAEMTLITVGMEGAEDLRNAKIMADYLGFRHEVHMFERRDIEALVPKAVLSLESFDEDCVSGAIANIFASSKAILQTKSILSGEGGDELFGGYHLLKEQPGDFAKLTMMKRLVEIAYNTAVQRLDRAMMANSIHYRTPFIDTDVIAFATQIPVQWKIHPDANGQLVEKYILREAFKDILPEEIYKRRKLRFAAGTGTDDIMDEVAADKVDAKEFESNRTTEAGYALNSPKELWYYRIFREQFPSSAFENLVGRWDPDK